MLVGSVAGGVVTYAHCPVLVAKWTFLVTNSKISWWELNNKKSPQDLGFILITAIAQDIIFFFNFSFTNKQALPAIHLDLWS